MLSSERDERPTAVQVKDGLKTIALQLFQPKTAKCRVCEQSFSSRSQLSRHLNETGHNRPAAETSLATLPAPGASESQFKAATCRTCQEIFPSCTELTKHFKQTGHYRSAAESDAAVLPALGASTQENGLRIRGYAEAPRAFKKENELRIRGCAEAPIQHYYGEGDLNVVSAAPCAVCGRRFNTKVQFYGHLGGADHMRNAKYVQKRKRSGGLTLTLKKKTSDLRSGPEKT
jgi:hypothetical protein